MTATCPTCAGAQMIDHPAGWLAWRHTNTCTIRDAEDARQVADHDGLGSDYTFTRPATEAERVLLQVLGHAVPDTLGTVVTYLTPGVHRRTWPVLDVSGAAP